ncbi:MULTISPECIES: response regulator [Vagococcus]|uniref:Transcriptional regulatory protein n=1 Tax=Vagococcus fluvialis bH819 TaxID=1255619 RepID=A0A1X6WSF0_9ENTE|nr:MULTISPECIES: response regulator [Vagococcus]SLM87220.1 Two-component response regulator, malate [Vagococcus fluvialis bH819]HCM89114.1 two-component system response regulator [Vagococcus sp.]
MTHILIIEDDPMVQFIHNNYLKKVNPAFNISASSTIAESRNILATEAIDLILLDIHLEDGNGLQLLSDLRKEKRDIDVILITASKEAILVKESLHLGVLDYLIKPFTYDRFEKSLNLYQKKIDQLGQHEMDQDQIDAFLQPKYEEETGDEELEKGLTQETLAFVIKTIKQMDKPFTIQELTDEAKLSHVSIRKYVAYLEKKEQLKSENIYLKVGRPYKVYVWG